MSYEGERALISPTFRSKALYSSRDIYPRLPNRLDEFTAAEGVCQLSSTGKSSGALFPPTRKRMPLQLSYTSTKRSAHAAKKLKTMTWEYYFQSLSAFKEEYGHCNVPRGYSDETLANWVAAQRIVKHDMPAERHARLTRLGLSWITSPQQVCFNFLRLTKTKEANAAKEPEEKTLTMPMPNKQAQIRTFD
jgi:hypothetical protein